MNKKFSVVVLAAAIALVCCAVPAEANLLSNPGFENDNAGGDISGSGDLGKIADWSVWYAEATTDGNYYDASDDANYAIRSGNRAVRQWTSTGWALFQDVAITPGQQYEASVFVYSGDTSGGDVFRNRNVQLKMIFSESSDIWGDYISDVTVDDWVPTVDPDTQWVKLAGVETAPAGAAYVRVEMNFSANDWGGSISYDDASLVVVPEPATATLLVLGLMSLFVFGRRVF